MPTEQSQAYCATCQRMVLIQRSTPNHLVHGLVTLFTCMAWGVVWLIASLSKSPWRCAFCGGREFGAVAHPQALPGYQAQGGFGAQPSSSHAAFEDPSRRRS